MPKTTKNEMLKGTARRVVAVRRQIKTEADARRVKRFNDIDERNDAEDFIAAARAAAMERARHDDE